MAINNGLDRNTQREMCKTGSYPWCDQFNMGNNPKKETSWFGPLGDGVANATRSIFSSSTPQTGGNRTSQNLTAQANNLVPNVDYNVDKFNLGMLNNKTPVSTSVYQSNWDQATIDKYSNVKTDVNNPVDVSAVNDKINSGDAGDISTDDLNAFLDSEISSSISYVNRPTLENYYDNNGMGDAENRYLDSSKRANQLRSDIQQLGTEPEYIDRREAQSMSGLRATRATANEQVAYDKNQVAGDLFDKNVALADARVQESNDLLRLQLLQGRLKSEYADNLAGFKEKYNFRQAELNGLTIGYGDSITSAQARKIANAKAQNKNNTAVLIKNAKEATDLSDDMKDAGIPVAEQIRLLEEGDVLKIRSAIVSQRDGNLSYKDRSVTDTVIKLAKKKRLIEKLSGSLKNEYGDWWLPGSSGSFGEADSFRGDIKFVGKSLSMDEVQNAKAKGVTFGAMTEPEWRLLEQIALKGLNYNPKTGVFDASENETKDKLEALAKFNMVKELAEIDKEWMVQNARSFSRKSFSEQERIYNNMIKTFQDGKSGSRQLNESEINDVMDKIDIRNADSKIKTQSASSFTQSSNGGVSYVPKTATSGQIIKKLVSLESGGKGYTARNDTSGAYGKYQFMTNKPKKGISTGMEYARQLGYRGNHGEELRRWMTPQRQNKMFSAFTKSNSNYLKKKGLPLNAFTLYGAHQQGAGGFARIMSNNKPNRTNMMRNLEEWYKKGGQERLKKLSTEEIRRRWINEWKRKTKIA